MIKIIFSMFALPILSIIQFEETGKGITNFNSVCWLLIILVKLFSLRTYFNNYTY
jgi:hypothetical protein